MSVLSPDFRNAWISRYKRGLIVRVDRQRAPALLDGLAIVPRPAAAALRARRAPAPAPDAASRLSVADASAVLNSGVPGAGALLRQDVGMQIEQVRVVRLPRELRLDRGQRPIEIVLLHGGEPLGRIAERLIGIELAGLREIGFGLVVVGNLHVQHAARDIERRRIRLKPEAVAQDVDAGLERLMGERDVREIEIEVDVLGLQQNGLPQRRDGVRRVAGLLVCRRRRDRASPRRA